MFPEISVHLVSESANKFCLDKTDQAPGGRKVSNHCYRLTNFIYRPLCPKSMHKNLYVIVTPMYTEREKKQKAF